MAFRGVWPIENIIQKTCHTLGSAFLFQNVLWTRICLVFPDVNSITESIWWVTTQKPQFVVDADPNHIWFEHAGCSISV